MVNVDTKHIVCFSGGHSSALVAIEVYRKFGKENLILLNHDINYEKESQCIKKFKKLISEYIGVSITYANYKNILDDTKIPNQFEVCIDAGALTSPNGNALCTALLKTIPFDNYLEENFSDKNCIIYYGFDDTETKRVNRRKQILGIRGFKTEYPLHNWSDRTILSTSEVGIEPPSTYDIYKHANCIGCLKASLLHWYVVYCNDLDTYFEGAKMEIEIDFTIHTVVRKGVKKTISLLELEPIFKKMQYDGIPATEHQSQNKFAFLISKYELEEINSKKPCECVF